MVQLYIGFSAPKRFKIGAEAIKLWQGGTKFSHVYLLVYSKFTEEWLVYQASHGMVHLLCYDRFLQENVVIEEFAVHLPEDNFKFTIKKAQQLLGAPYGYLGLIKLVCRRFFKVKGDKMASFHCSELIATLFPNLAKTHELDFIEPIHLYQVLKVA